MKMRFKKRISIKKTVIIAGIVLFGLFLPTLSQAIDLSPSGIAKGLIKLITNLILSFFGLIVGLAAKFFEATLNLGFQSHKTIVEVGWKVTRDFSNMFFILFMIIIAFATILRLEQYGIKKLLPKVIIIALLINFSLIISYVIIDFTNISARFFINDAEKGAKALGGDKASISGALADSLNLTKVLIPRDCKDLKKEKEQCASICESDSDCTDRCREEKEEAYDACKAGVENLKAAGKEATFGNMILSTVFGSIVLMIAAFILFAGGIFLIIRILFLWFLVMLVPFAFLSYIMPGLKHIWQDWWKTFLKWSFFAPAYAFFIWLAVKISVENKLAKMSTLLGKTSSLAGNPSLITKFESSMQNIIGFIFIGGLLIGGLIAAQKLSIHGAGTAVKLGQKWGRGAARRITRYPKEIAGALGAGTLQTTGRTFQRIPGLKKFGRGMETRGTMLMRKPEESPDAKRYKAVAENMSEENLIKDVKSRSGVYGLIATKVATEKGFLQKTKDRDAVQTGINTLRGYGMTKEADELEQKRFSVIKNDDNREEIAKKAEAKGVHKEWKAQVFEGVPGQKAAATFAKIAPTITIAIERAKQMRSDTQEQYGKALFANFVNNNDFADNDNIKQRSVFAAASGKLHVAFTDSSTGTINKATLGNFVKNMKPKDFAGIDPSSVKHVADFVDASAAVEMGRQISAEMKKEFANVFKTKDPAFKNILKKNPGWASFIT